MLDEKLINRKLKRLYGEQEGGQNFRLVRTNEQFEVRNAPIFHEFAIAPTWKFQRLPKYNYLGDYRYWVLERLFPLTEDMNKHIAGTWTYEPVFIYCNVENKDPLPVTEDSIHAFIGLSLAGPKRKKTPQEITAEEEAFYEKQSTVILEYLQNEMPSMAVQLRAGSGIAVPEKYGESDNRIISSNGDSGIQAGDGSIVSSDSSRSEG